MTTLDITRAIRIFSIGSLIDTYTCTLDDIAGLPSPAYMQAISDLIGKSVHADATIQHGDVVGEGLIVGNDTTLANDAQPLWIYIVEGNGGKMDEIVRFLETRPDCTLMVGRHAFCHSCDSARLISNPTILFGSSMLNQDELHMNILNPVSLWISEPYEPLPETVQKTSYWLQTKDDWCEEYCATFENGTPPNWNPNWRRGLLSYIDRVLSPGISKNLDGKDTGYDRCSILSNVSRRYKKPAEIDVNQDGLKGGPGGVRSNVQQKTVILDSLDNFVPQSIQQPTWICLQDTDESLLYTVRMLFLVRYLLTTLQQRKCFAFVNVAGDGSGYGYITYTPKAELVRNSPMLQGRYVYGPNSYSTELTVIYPKLTSDSEENQFRFVYSGNTPTRILNLQNCTKQGGVFSLSVITILTHFILVKDITFLTFVELGDIGDRARGEMFSAVAVRPKTSHINLTLLIRKDNEVSWGSELNRFRTVNPTTSSTINIRTLD